MSSSSRVFYAGTTEYLEVAVTADFELAAQPVHISFDRRAWLEAEWTGDPGTTRHARVLLNAANLPRTGDHCVFVRVTDDPEVPVFGAGGIKVK